MKNAAITIHSQTSSPSLTRLIEFLQSCGVMVELCHDPSLINYSPYFMFDEKLILLSEDLRISYDWVKEFKTHQKKKYSIHNEPFAKALGLKNKRNISLLDTSGGTGKDAILAYSFGLSVDIYERNVDAFCLLACAFLRFRDSDCYNEQFPMNLKLGTLNADVDLGHYDCVFFDPMYPQKKKKSAKARKEMELFKEIIGPDDDADSYLEQLIHKHHYVVFKRPSFAPKLHKPSYSYEGRTTRYDIYRKV